MSGGWRTTGAARAGGRRGLAAVFALFTVLLLCGVGASAATIQTPVPRQPETPFPTPTPDQSTPTPDQSTAPPADQPEQLASSDGPPIWVFGAVAATVALLGSGLTGSVIRRRHRRAMARKRASVLVHATLVPAAAVTSVAEPRGAVRHSIRVHTQPGTPRILVEDERR